MTTPTPTPTHKKTIATIKKTIKTIDNASFKNKVARGMWIMFTKNYTDFEYDFNAWNCPSVQLGHFVNSKKDLLEELLLDLGE